MSSKPSPQTAPDAPLNQDQLLRLVGYNCRRAYMNILPQFFKRMEKFDLRPVDYTILTLVNANPSINQKRLAQAIGVAPPNMAPLLDRLEQRGLLARQRNPADKRSQVLVLSDEGRRLCTQADRIAFKLERDATAVLSDAERNELLRLLQKIYLDAAPEN